MAAAQSIRFLYQAALDGIGAATLLRSLAVTINGLWPISFEPPEYLGFKLCWRNDRYLSKANRAFIDFARLNTGDTRDALPQA